MSETPSFNQRKHPPASRPAQRRPARHHARNPWHEPLPHPPCARRSRMPRVAPLGSGPRHRRAAPCPHGHAPQTTSRPAAATGSNEGRLACIGGEVEGDANADHVAVEAAGDAHAAPPPRRPRPRHRLRGQTDESAGAAGPIRARHASPAPDRRTSRPLSVT